jgi:hypothetical protein
VRGRERHVEPAVAHAGFGLRAGVPDQIEIHASSVR